jgi:GT2 family glycosyltransferase
MTEPSIAIVILNWNGWQDTVNCLRSLRNLTYQNYHIVLIDNGSTDNSIKEIIPNLNPRIHFICNKDNLGFAKASNQGITYAIDAMGSEYVWLLNNDTTVESNTLSLMVQAMKDPLVGMVQPLMLRMNSKHVIDSTGHIILWGQVYDRGVEEINKGQYQDAIGLIGVSGAAGLYSVKMIHDIGMLDESYGTCFEDSEYSWRAFKCGWKTAYIPDAIVYHKRSESLNRMISIDPEFAKQLYLRAYRPCKTHGNSIQKMQFVASMGWMAAKSYMGYCLRRNVVGASPYVGMIREMIR